MGHLYLSHSHPIAIYACPIGMTFPWTSLYITTIRAACMWKCVESREIATLKLLRSDIPSGMCAKLRTVATSNNRDHARNLSSRTLVIMFNRSHVNIGRATTSQSLLLLLARATHIYFCSSRTSRSWWIIQSTQRHRRGCNSTKNLRAHSVERTLSVVRPRVLNLGFVTVN